MNAWHLSIRTRSRVVVAPLVSERRALARLVTRLAAPRGLLAFRFTGHHGHVLVEATRAEAGVLAGVVASTWSRGAGRAFEPTHLEPVETQRHLRRAFEYVLRNERGHGLDTDPAHDASSLPELLGLRLLDLRPVARVRALLPEVDRALLLDIAGVPALAPAADPALLLDAAAAAIGREGLVADTPDRVAARLAAVHAAGPAPAAELAVRLGITPRAVQRLRAREPAPALVRAVGLQVDPRRQLAARLAAGPFLAP